MLVFDFYIYSNSGECLLHEPLSTRSDSMSQSDKHKLLFGLLYSMKSFSRKISPEWLGVTPFTSFVTGSYKLHILETMSGLNFVLLTEETAGELTEKLQYLYSELFSQYVVRSPLYRPKQAIHSPLFVEKVKEFLGALV
jgi:hypothetical protein